MVNFACKTIKVEEIIKCGLSISKSDFRILGFLLKRQGKSFTTKDISSRTGLNITTVQRSVKDMNEKGLIWKDQKNLKNGGYLFLYSVKDKQQLKERIIKIIKDWEKSAEREVEAWVGSA